MKNERKKRDDEDARSTALFRFRVLVPLLEEQAAERLRERVAACAARSHVHPQRGECRVSERTLWDWLRRFRQEGLEGLHPPTAGGRDAGLDDRDLHGQDGDTHPERDDRSRGRGDDPAGAASAG